MQMSLLSDDFAQTDAKGIKKVRSTKKSTAQLQSLDLFADIEAHYDPMDLFVMAEEIPILVAKTIPEIIKAEQVDSSPRNYIMTEADEAVGNLKERFAANLAAITTLKTIEKEYRYASPEEQSMLARYKGFGGIPQAFVPDKDEWKEQYAALKEAVSDEEYESLKATTLNAHYTSIAVIDFMYKALLKMGFSGGRILEPALGIGYFLGRIPQTIKDNCTITATEIDSITGRIAQQLFPVADIKVKGYETYSIDDNTFDLAISNVPFGAYKVYDPAYKSFKFSIHDYFFAKCIDKIRHGGLLAFVTSRYTMDKKNSSIREYLSERADLVAAFRLPETAFRKIANTTVTTDIIILQKKQKKDAPKDEKWLDTSRITPTVTGSTETMPTDINKYYVENPQMLLGTVVMDSSDKGYQQTLKPDGRELSDALDTALAAIPANIYTATDETTAASMPKKMAAPDTVKEGAYLKHEDEVCRNINGSISQEKMPENTAARIKALIKLRNKVRAVIKRQQEIKDDEKVNLDIDELNTIYDNFVRNYGYIHSRTNSIAFRQDPDYPLLLALEDYNDETKKATKADIFKKRLMYPAKRIDTVETAKEALVVSLNEYGGINFERMSALTSKSEEELISELGELVYKNTDTNEWEIAEQYLSGNVRKKLDAAIKASEQDNQYYRNVEALTRVQPTPLKASEIEARLGSPWIPATDVADFINHIINIENAVRVTYSPAIATWLIEKNIHKSIIDNSVNNTNKWGTARSSALHLIEQALNHHLPTIKDPVDMENGEIKYVINVKETEASREKQFNLKEKFKTWIWQDSERRARLEEKYNREMNNIRERIFDGSHLTFPGMIADVSFRPHQKNAVWRIMQNGNTLLYHKVGHGKTYVICAAIMEGKRIGLINKGVITVPGHLIDQWGEAFLRLYPCANILLARKEDFEKKKRKIMLSKIATGDWDAVIISHTSYEKVPVDKETLRIFMQEQIDEIVDAIGPEKDKNNTRMVKKLQRKKKQLEFKLKEKMCEYKKDDVLVFEELGIDLLAVDEADTFKNLYFTSKMPSVAGLSKAESQRAYDMHVKTQYLNKRYNEKSVVFATGTAIANSLGELFTMQRYLQPTALNEYGIATFDSWAHSFGETISSLEIAPDGSGYRVNTRFSKFTNIPELMSIFKMIADINLEDLQNVAMPKIKGGKPETVSAEISREQKDFTLTLVDRAEKIKARDVEPSEDNMLMVTSDGRKAALDMRLIDVSCGDNPESKINHAITNIHRIWEATSDRKLTQMVFCDLSTPHNKEFNVYDDIRGKLIKKGIPKDEIVYIHEANTDLRKKSLFDSFRAGRTRILLGSTEKMGAGTDVQKRLFAMHNLDAPWRPRDMEQRLGRIERQGNMNPEIEVYTYVTKESFDAYIFQTLEVKAKFISQITKSNSTIRTAEDCMGGALTYAEVKAIASGNRTVIEKFQVETEMRRINLLKSQYISTKYEMESEIGILPQKIENRKKFLAYLESDMANVPTGDFRMTIYDQTYAERKIAGFQLQKSALALKDTGMAEEVGAYGGFRLYVKSTPHYMSSAIVIAKGAAEYRGEISHSDVGTIASLDHDIRHIKDKVIENRNDIEQMSRKLDDLMVEVAKPFPHDEALEKLERRHKEIFKELGLDKNEPTDMIDMAGDQEEDMDIAA